MSTDTYYKKVMDDLDALLADLQSTTNPNQSQAAAVSPRNSTGSSQQRYSSSSAQSPRLSGRGETPPPLPPPPHDIPDTIPPPQQFVDQPLYEAQNVKSHNRFSSSSGTSQGSGDQVFYNRAPPGGQQQQGMSSISNNLTELDQLLSDLNSAQFLAEVDKKHPSAGNQPISGSGKVAPVVAPKPGRGERNSVDTLLDQLESSVPAPQDKYGGYPVQTNVVNYSYQPPNTQKEYSYDAVQEYNVQAAPPPSQGQSSTATRELDELMSSLSGFKQVGGKAPGGQAHVQVPGPPRSPSPGSEPSYAKPYKSRNLSPSSSANSSLQSSSITPNMSSSSAQGGQLDAMLGDLQSDMSKQGVNTKTKGLCAACNQPVVGQVITALGKIWHIEHFMCAHCHETLGTKNFYERDGQAYCERDYHSLFAPRCAYCNGPIVDKCVTALNNTWHPEHFFCAQCGRPFGDDGFHERDGKAFCRADYFEMFAPKCGGCARAIVDNYISALNRHWHPECFACWDCHQPFAGGSFFDYEGLPYCETHYHAKRGSLCAGCQAPITGRCITAMFKKFHPEHFVCAFCLKQLNKGTFKEQNDKPYCHPCFVKLFS